MTTNYHINCTVGAPVTRGIWLRKRRAPKIRSMNSAISSGIRILSIDARKKRQRGQKQRPSYRSVWQERARCYLWHIGLNQDEPDIPATRTTGLTTADHDLISSDTLHGDESSGPAVSGVSGGALAASKAVRGCGVGRSLERGCVDGDPLGLGTQISCSIRRQLQAHMEGNEARPCSKFQRKDESRCDSSQRSGLASTRNDDALIQQRKLQKKRK